MSKAGAGLIVCGMILAIFGIFGTTIVSQYQIGGYTVYQQQQQGIMMLVIFGIVLVIIGAILQVAGARKTSGVQTKTTTGDLVAGNYCPACGTKLSESAVYCRKCGAHIEE